MAVRNVARDFVTDSRTCISRGSMVEACGATLVNRLAADRENKRNTAFVDQLVWLLGVLDLSQVEMSMALGSYVNEQGTRGTCSVNAWLRRAERAPDRYLEAVRILTKGTARIRVLSPDKRRRQVEIVQMWCPDCCKEIWRAGGKDVCSCGYSDPVNDDLVVDVLLWLCLHETYYDLQEALGDTLPFVLREENLTRCDAEEIRLWLTAGDASMVTADLKRQLQRAAADVVKGNPTVKIRRGFPSGCLSQGFFATKGM